MTNTTCPRCGADDPLPIRYGYPDMADVAEAEAGRAVIGGCVIEITVAEDGTEVGPPVWSCRSCGERFGVLQHDT